jgi:TonB family protein
MDKILLSLLKVSAGTTLFYLCYLLLFSKDTFYLRNRILLILTLVIPTIIPAIKIPVLINTFPQMPVTVAGNFVFSASFSGTPISGSVNSFDYIRLFVWIYFTITAFLLLRIGISLISTRRIIKNGVIKKSHFPKVVVTENKLPPFSFFPYAVIPVKDYERGNYTDILDHEFAHIRQGHTFDLLLSELFIAFQWFNPFVWLIKRSVILNHEYLADNISISNKSIKEYQYRLLNFKPGLKNISLAHNFNSQIKNRIIMINKKPTQKYATLKNILILPVVALVLYAFATPEYHTIKQATDLLTIYQAPGLMQKEVKGIVLNGEGKPLEGVHISSTGKPGEASLATSGHDGRFSIGNVQENATLLFFCRGYKELALKPDFNKDMSVKMEKDPDYKIPEGTNPGFPSAQNADPIVVIDGIISKKTSMAATKELGYNMGITKYITGKEATDKYGEKGANGVWEITTRNKALEMGLKPPFPRLSPDDFPTFQNQKASGFSEWVVSHVKYPADARTNKIEGWVSLNFTVELNGSISNVVSTIPVDRILSDEVARVVQSSPKWDPPKNPNVDEPLTSNVTLKFKLPGEILGDNPYVMVEQMPMYPGGDIELLNFIKSNTKYPEAAKKGKIEGRVIVRFIVSTEGNAEGVSVLKGVDPLLDAEAIRVVSRLKGFTPGMQGGKPVNVWYMVPVNYSLASPDPLFSKTAELEILKFLGMNTGYPQEAKASADTGRIFVVVKLEKGGIIKECKAYNEKTGIKAPFLPEVVIVGYKPSEGQIIRNTENAAGKEHPVFKTECLRVANLLSVNEIPDWKDKNMEFVLTFKFVLK